MSAPKLDFCFLRPRNHLRMVILADRPTFSNDTSQAVRTCVQYTSNGCADPNRGSPASSGMCSRRDAYPSTPLHPPRRFISPTRLNPVLTKRHAPVVAPLAIPLRIRPSPFAPQPAPRPPSLVCPSPSTHLRGHCRLLLSRLHECMGGRGSPSHQRGFFICKSDFKYKTLSSKPAPQNLFLIRGLGHSIHPPLSHGTIDRLPAARHHPPGHPVLFLVCPRRCLSLWCRYLASF